ncbi:MAG: hypothetical protein IPN76_26870 [Saprospiraceae bacterium]|nr:hypothetical protein [Saprospiraceae bacterium]
MKTNLSILCFSLLVLTSFSTQKTGIEEIQVKGLRFDKELTDALKKTPEQPAFFFDNKAILRPTASYQIIYEKVEKALVLIPKATTYSAFKQLDGYEEIQLPGGILVGCMCDGTDDCHFDNSKIERKFVCTGTCRCYIGVSFNNPPLEYETMGGQWIVF